MSSTLKSYEINSSGEVVVHLDDETHLVGDILIGADGIWSRTRSILFDESARSELLQVLQASLDLNYLVDFLCLLQWNFKIRVLRIHRS